MVEAVDLDFTDPQWRTVKGACNGRVHAIVYSRLLFTFTDPLTVIESYERGELEIGTFAAKRPGELPGSTYVVLSLSEQESTCVI